MSKLFSSPKAQPIPAAPPPPELIDFRDEVTGTETVTVWENGVQKRVTRRIPRSPEEQALFDLGTKLVNENIARIQSLSELDPEASSEFGELLNTFRTNEERKLAESQTRTRSAQENALKQSGLSDSTSAAETRAALANYEVGQAQEVKSQTRLLGEDLRNQAIARAQGLLAVGTGLRADDRQLAMSGTTSEQAMNLLGIQGQLQNQAYQNQVAAIQANNANKKSSFGSQLLGVAGTIGGAYLGGPAGASFGSSLFGSGARAASPMWSTSQPIPLPWLQ